MKLNVVVNGRILRKYDLNSNIFVEGWKGSNYSLQLQNNTNKKTKAVVGIDGINIVSFDSNWDQGIILDPNEIVTISQYIKNKNLFIFGNNKSSLGSIGVKWYKEKDSSHNYRRIIQSNQVQNIQEVDFDSELVSNLTEIIYYDDANGLTKTWNHFRQTKIIFT